MTAAQAGIWTIHGYCDDYVSLKIDDEWAFVNKSMGQYYNTVKVSKGWHRFRLIAGDTGGGYGGRIIESSHDFVTPLVVKINGAGEYAFASENFTFGSGTQTVKLGADCDWRALGEVVLDTGATIDLNGHELKVSSVKGDNLKARVTSSASNGKLAIYNGSVNANNLTVDNVTVATARAATPTSPTATTFFANSHSVTLQCATSGATIRYTTDGSEPTASSTAYTASITITDTTTIKAVAFADAYLESETFAQTFMLAPQAAAPTQASAVQGYRSTLVDLAATTPGAVIHYTTDGSDPTAESQVYGGSIDVTNRTDATTVKARVYADGYRPSDVFTYDYYVKRLFGETTGPNPAEFEDTPRNRAQHWILEDKDHKEATGLWAPSVEYVNEKVTIDAQNEFAVDNPAGGRIVTIETKASFNSLAEDHQDFAGVKAAVRIGTNSCFQVYTRDGGDNLVWRDTEGFEARANTDYTVRLQLDLTNKTYTVSVVDKGTRTPLSAEGRKRFAFATPDSSAVTQVGFVGEGSVTSINGKYTNATGVSVTLR